MLELLTTPPPMDVIARMVAIEGVQVTPTIVASQQGPDRRLGPEAAGAILVLQATFTDEDRAAGFWQTAAGLMEQLATAPGFIRRYNFTDGPHYTLIAFWRTTADAHAFFSSDPTRRRCERCTSTGGSTPTSRDCGSAATPRERVIFCQDCDGVTPATAGTCRGCGAELFDPYDTASHAGR